MKTLIIGAGGIAHHHLNALKALGEEVYGIYDISMARAQELASQYGTKAVGEIEEALGCVDTVFLLTPPSTRLEYMKKIRGKCRNVFCEKPAAIEVSDALAMERIAAEEDMICMVGFTQRFRSGYARLKEILGSGELGEIVQAIVLRIGPGPGSDGNLSESWRTDRNYVCGMTIESLSHDIDFLQSLAGPIRSVSGVVKGTVPQLAEFDNNSNAVLVFESGAAGSITCSWSSALPFTMKGIIGTKGTAFLQGNDIWDNTSLVVRTFSGEERVEKLNDIFQDGEGYLNEDRYFLECVRESKKPVCGLDTGRQVLQISHRILDTSKDLKNRGTDYAEES